MIFISVLLLFKCVFTRMSDSESIKKMLRSVLQSSKAGVSISHLQSEYRSLCGENIPLKRLGYSKLEEYLRSIPSVARLEYHMGEVRAVFFLIYPGLRPLFHLLVNLLSLTWFYMFLHPYATALGQLASAQN